MTTTIAAPTVSSAPIDDAWIEAATRIGREFGTIGITELLRLKMRGIDIARFDCDASVREELERLADRSDPARNGFDPAAWPMMSADGRAFRDLESPYEPPAVQLSGPRNSFITRTSLTEFSDGERQSEVTIDTFASSFSPDEAEAVAAQLIEAAQAARAAVIR